MSLFPSEDMLTKEIESWIGLLKAYEQKKPAYY